MAFKNSQILLIENVLSNINENLHEKEELIKEYEVEVTNLKNTITTLKHECKSSFHEQERLEENINDLKKQNIFLSQELKAKDEKIHLQGKEFDSMRIKHEQFMDNIEKKIEEFKEELSNKNSIILELENINKELNKKLDTTQKEKSTSISKLARKLEKEELKNFINTDNNYDFSSTSSDAKKVTTTPSRINKNLQLDKLEDKLKNLNKIKEDFIKNKESTSSEEDEIKKRLGF